LAGASWKKGVAAANPIKGEAGAAACVGSGWKVADELADRGWLCGADSATGAGAENMDVPGLLMGNGCAGPNCEAADVKSDGDGFTISAGAVGAAGAKAGADAGDDAADGARKGELVPGTELDSMGAKGA
jgi:hypothetical protein